jgi:hypothetical protein
MNDHDPFALSHRVGAPFPPGQEGPVFDRPIREKKHSRAIRIAVWVLLAALALYLLYAVLVHPINKVKLQFFLAQSGRISVAVQRGPASGEATVRIDGNLISITPEQGFAGTQYYEVDGEQLYYYRQGLNGEWDRIALEESILQIGSGDGFAIKTDALLDRSNYERVPGKLLVWRIRDGVDVGGIEDVELCRKNGKVTITASIASEYLSYITLTFEYIGFTVVDPPWEE